MIRRGANAVADVTGTAYTLDVQQLDVTKDEAWSPHVQASVTVPLDVISHANTDPTGQERLLVTVSDVWNDFPLDLSLRQRQVDYKAGEITLDLASDEAILQAEGYAPYPPVPDESPRQYEADLRELIDNVALAVIPGAALLPGDANADLTIYRDAVNLLTNPSFETDTASWTAVGATMTRSTGGGTTAGSYMCRVHTPTSATLARIESSSFIPVTPGETYVLEGDLTIPAGTAAGTPTWYHRCLVAVDNAGAVIAFTPSAALGSASPQRLSVTFTVPEGVTELKVRLINGHPSGAVAECRFDSIRLSPVVGAHDSGYFDGATTDTAEYAYAWTGTAHASTSTRTNLTGFERSLDMFTVYPGMTWWDYIAPIVEAAGLRLFCNEYREWQLVDPETFLAPGSVNLALGVNILDMAETVDVDSADYADTVVVEYDWTDADGVQQRAWDAVAGSLKLLKFDRNTPYPGPGAAAALAARLQRRARTYDYVAPASWDVEASAPALLTDHEGDAFAGNVAAVRLSLPSGDMVVTIRDPIDASPISWALLAPGEAWNESAPGDSWIEETV